MLHPPDVHSQPKPPSTLYLIISRHPFLVLGLGWAIIIVTATLGLATLLSPGETNSPTDAPTATSTSLPPESPASTTETITVTPSPTPETSPDSESSLPVFTTPAEPLEPEVAAPPTSPLSLWTLGAIALGCAGGSLLLTLALKQAAISSTRPKQVKGKRKKRPSSSRRVPPPQQSPNQQTQVTVLPNDVTHPLDSDQEDLASEMDLRKRHTLSSLLRN